MAAVLNFQLLVRSHSIATSSVELIDLEIIRIALVSQAVYEYPVQRPPSGTRHFTLPVPSYSIVKSFIGLLDLRTLVKVREMRCYVVCQLSYSCLGAAIFYLTSLVRSHSRFVVSFICQTSKTYVKPSKSRYYLIWK